MMRCTPRKHELVYVGGWAWLHKSRTRCAEARSKAAEERMTA